MLASMVQTATPRMGLPQWSADTDTWPARAGFNTIFDTIDDLTAIDLTVPDLASRPAAGTAGRYCYVTATERLYRDTGSAWKEVAIATGWAAHAVVLHNAGGVDVTEGDMVKVVRSCRVGPVRKIVGALKIGATTNLGTAGGSLYLTGLVEATGESVEQLIRYQTSYYDTSAAAWYGGFGLEAGATAAASLGIGANLDRLYLQDGNSSDLVNASTVPFAWAAGDLIVFSAEVPVG